MSKELEFDPSVMRDFAERLYSKAGFITVTFTLFGLVLGMFAGAYGHRFIGLQPSWIPMFFIASTVLLGLAGYSVGSERAFKYRLEAQRTLCQLSIELNTRR